ncbi:MAG: DUF4386 domain-containing protein [Gemmatimonadota bacterium]
MPRVPSLRALSAVLAEGAPASADMKARIAGFLYLIVIVGGIFAQIFVRDALVVSGNAAATASNITAHELRYRLGFAVEVFYLLCNVPLTLLIFDVFKVVNRKLMLLAALFSVVGTAVEGVSLLAHYAPLILLGKSATLTAFTAEQLQAAAYLSIRMFDYGFMIALAFFGWFCILLGTVIVRSTFFPRFVGVLLWIEGIAYLVNSFANFIAPAVGAKVFPFLLVSGLAEISFCLTLLIAGVNVPRWTQQAR